MVALWFALTLGAVAQVTSAPAFAPSDWEVPQGGAFMQGLPPVADLEAANESHRDVIGTPADNLSRTWQSTGWLLTASWISQRVTDGFGTTDLGIVHGWAWLGSPNEQPVRVAPGIGMHFLSGPTELELPGVVYDVFLDLSWRVWEREHGGISVGVTPGMYGDFQVVSSDLFQVTGWIVGDLRLGPHWTLSGGVAVVRQLESSWLPIGGVTWTPSEDWQLDITIPRPRIARRLLQTEERDWWCYVAGQYGGGSWSVADGDGGTLLLSYSDMRVLLGLNTWHVSNREWSWEIGYVFSRDIAADRYTLVAPSDTWVMQIVASF